MNVNERIEKWMPLASKIAYKYSLTTSIDFEELKSEAYIGLIKAAQNYDENINKFSTFAYKCICNTLSMYLKKQKKSVKALNFIDSFDVEEQKRINIQDFKNSKLTSLEYSVLDLLEKGNKPRHIVKELNINKYLYSCIIKSLREKYNE